MRRKLLIVALVAGMLPTLFSCREELSKNREDFIKGNTSIKEIKGIGLPTGDDIDVIINESDTIVIFSKRLGGSVVIERKPINK